MEQFIPHAQPRQKHTSENAEALDPKPASVHSEVLEFYLFTVFSPKSAFWCIYNYTKCHISTSTIIRFSKYLNCSAMCSSQAHIKILCNIIFYRTKKIYTKTTNSLEKYTFTRVADRLLFSKPREPLDIHRSPRLQLAQLFASLQFFF